MSIVPPDVRHPDRAPTVAFDFRVHASLVRPVLYLGVERHVIALEATLSGGSVHVQWAPVAGNCKKTV